MSRSFGGRSLTTRSPMTISPPVISSSPATIRSVVDLPQPDGPTSTMNSLSRMWRFTSLTAWTSSYFLLRLLSSTWAMVGGLPSIGSPESGAPGAVRRPGRARPPHGTSPGELGVNRLALNTLARRPARPGPRLALDGAGEPGDVVLDEKGVHEGDRDGAEQGAGHELAPEIDVAADHLRHHADRHRLALG